MIVIKVELWSAIDGRKQELARMMIHNVNDEGTKADYAGETYRGRHAEALDLSMRNRVTTRKGKVNGHRKLDLHVWHLVGKMLSSMGYGKT